MKRRDFIALTAGATLTSGMAAFMVSQDQADLSILSAAEKIDNSSLHQPPLPYKLDALAPFLSQEQMDYHYNKHHAAYFKNLAGLLATDEKLKNQTLEQIVRESTGGIFNNAAQAWNHTFFWNCMIPTEVTQNIHTPKAPTGKLAQAINRDFGGLTGFQEKFKSSAASLFGSGWTWLAKDKNEKLEILQTSNADTPLRTGKTPILVIDVWEHAYYVDYRNERVKFIAGFMDHIHWPFAEKQFNG